MREFHRARIPMGSRGRFLDYVRSGPLIETYMARKRMAHSALRKYVSLERAALMGAFSYLSLFRGARLLQVHVLRVHLYLFPVFTDCLIYYTSETSFNKPLSISLFLFMSRIISQIFVLYLHVVIAQHKENL